MASERLHSLQEVAADETWLDTDATCSSPVEDVDIRAYSLEQACDAHTLVLGLALLGFRTRPPLRAETGSSGLRSVPALA